MKKNQVVLLVPLILMGGVGAFMVFRKPQHQPQPDLPQTVHAEIKSKPLPAKTAGEETIATVSKRNSRLERHAGEKRAGEMSDEEYRLIEESFNISAPMTGFLDDGDDLKALYEARKLLQHPNREVRLEVAQALSWIGLPAAMELAKMMDDPDAEVRNIAQDAFWEAFDEAENAVLKRDLLAEALRSGDPEMRARALEELVFLPDALAYSALASALNDPDETVAELARENVSFISGEEIVTRAQADAWYAANQTKLQEELAEEMATTSDSSVIRGLGAGAAPASQNPSPSMTDRRQRKAR